MFCISNLKNIEKKFQNVYFLVQKVVERSSSVKMMIMYQRFRLNRIFVNTTRKKGPLFGTFPSDSKSKRKFTEKSNRVLMSVQSFRFRVKQKRYGEF